jgi:formate hydrogenlyase transcriptional activator
MQSRPATHPESSGELRRYEALLEMADLMVRHRTLPELFHELALGLKKVADFHYLNFSIHIPHLKIMQLNWWEGGGDAAALPEEVPMAESPSGWTWEHQQELLFPSLQEETRFPRSLDYLRAKGVLTYYVVPLSTAEKRLGALGVASLKGDAYSEPDRRLLRRVAELAAVAVENTMNREDLHDEKQRLQALVDVNRTLASNLEIQRLLPLISECVDRVVPHDFAGVTLYEGDKENMKAYVLSPTQPGVIESGRTVSLQQTLSSQAFLEQKSKTLTREDLANHSSSIAERVLGAGIRTVHCMPLFTSKGPLGTLNVGSKKDRAFSQKDEEVLNQIAAQLAIALDNARAYREIQTLKDRLAEEKLYLEDEIRTELNFEEIIGDSLELKRVLSQAKTVAPSGSTVLILGETGTGKELIARAIHRMSKRKNASFIKVNCAAIPMGLLESELFGHEKGAFTGAVKKIGRMELADKGSLFLDEVGDIPLELQPKLLRVLQDHEFERLGSNRTVRVDLRLVAATNRDLSQRVAEGDFRSDLFYRLNVFPIHMPPLRNRRSDIPLLVRHFVKKLARRMDKRIDTIPSETMEALVNWHWPGNIRELENLMERSVILSDGPVLKTQLPEREPESGEVAGSDTTLANAEREHIIRVLRECGGLVSGPRGAALRLGLKRTTLQSKMTKLNISKKDYTG